MTLQMAGRLRGAELERPAVRVVWLPPDAEQPLGGPGRAQR
jgi:hypothetical protein